MNTQLAFRETKFTPVKHNGQIWLTSKELARALDYKNTKSIANLYNENEDEFTSGMSLVIDSVTNGINSSSRRLKIRIFSLRGAHLIAMFARTPVAKEFRRWVLDILDRETGDPIATPVSPVPSHPSEVHAFCDDYANRTEIIFYQDFKPIFCRILQPEEIVLTPEGMKEWMGMQGVVFFTREELKNLSYGQWLVLVE